MDNIGFIYIVLFRFLLPSSHDMDNVGPIDLVLFRFLLPSPHDMDNVGPIDLVLFRFLLPSPHDMDNVGPIDLVLFPFLLPSPHDMDTVGLIDGVLFPALLPLFHGMILGHFGFFNFVLASSRARASSLYCFVTLQFSSSHFLVHFYLSLCDTHPQHRKQLVTVKNAFLLASCGL